MWMSLVEMNVWIRQRSAPFSASAARSMSPVVVRASAAITGPLHAGRDLADRVELAVGGDREAGLEDVDVQPGELLGDLDLLGPRERDPGGLLAVAQGGVEDPDWSRGYRFAADRAVRCRSAHSGTTFFSHSNQGIIWRSSRPTSSSWDVRASLPKSEELREPGVGLGDPLLGERAVLDLGEDCAHLLARALVDHARTAHVVAVLGRVGDRVAHPRQAALVDQVDDQLQLVQALEVGDLGLVAGLDERVEPVLDQRRTIPPHSTVCSPNRSVSVSSLKVVSMMPARAQPIAGAVGQGPLQRVAGGVLLHGDQRRRAVALLVGAAHQVAGALGAIIVTSTSAGGVTVPKWIENPCANISMSPAFRFGAMSAA